MADKLTAERKRQQTPIMLTNEHQEQNLTADLDDIQRDTTGDFHVESVQQELVSVKVLQQHCSIEYEAEVLTLRQKTEGPQFRLDEEPEAFKDTGAQKSLIMNDMKPEQRAFCQKVMEELEVERESNLSLREELMKVRASHQEMNRMYEADLNTLRRHINFLQQELEKEKKSHEDTVSKHQLLLQNLRTEQDTFCQRITQEIKLDVENTAEEKMLLLRAMENLKSQLDDQLSLKPNISTEFKVEREDNQLHQDKEVCEENVLLMHGPDIEIVVVESPEKNRFQICEELLPNVLLKQELESEESDIETVEVQSSEESQFLIRELELNEQKMKLTEETQKNQTLTNELETLRQAVTNASVEMFTMKNPAALKIRELEDIVGAEHEKREAAEATLTRQVKLVVKLIFALTGAHNSLEESRSQWEQERSRLLAEHRQETDRIMAMLRLEEEGRRRRLEWQRDMFAFLESLGINDDSSVGHGIGGGGDGWERTGRSSNI
ncbi:paramyosin-like [Solea solea]|uniref:paramyosin-like n=1 Tax=Solea solea TaxID=90069 RepID=UPI00272D7EE7|nr:paramyosin-like [Solea solea]